MMDPMDAKALMHMLLQLQDANSEPSKKIANQIKRLKTMRKVRIEHFATSKIRENTNRFQDLVQCHTTIVMTNCIILIAGVLCKQMDLFIKVRLVQNDKIVAGMWSSTRSWQSTTCSH